MSENSNNRSQGLSAVEAELYDRQIRLWGVESQEKLRSADILLIGVRGLGSEVAKNICLSGINSLTILDNGVVTEEEQIKNFFLPRSSIGNKIAEAVVKKLQALNPLVKITTDTDDVASKPFSFFEKFTIVIGTRMKNSLVLKIAKTCRNAKVKFICGEVFGMFGYTYADFQEHEFFINEVVLPEKKRAHDGTLITGEKTIVRKVRTFSYPDLNKVLILPDTKQKTESIKKTKRRNPLFYLMLILIEFRNKQGRDPSHAKKDEDIEKLIKIKADVLKLYEVSEDKVDNALFNLVFGEIVSVCSVIGGMLAQEAIKAVSYSEVPVNNVFLFNPVTYAGNEELVGA